MTDARVNRRDEETWWGVSPRTVAVSLGALCVGVVLASRHHPLVGLVVGGLGVGLAIPVGEGDVVTWSSHRLGYLARRRWVLFSPPPSVAGGRLVPVVGYPTLSDADPLDLSSALERVARRGGGVLGVHVRQCDGVRELLVAADQEVEPTALWSPSFTGRWREYPTHLRSTRHVVQIGRVAKGVEGYWPLHSLLTRDGSVRLVVVARVVGEGEGRRRSSRRAHRADADGATLSARGFRLSAGRRTLRERVAIREVEIARGRAWVEWGAYVVLESVNLAGLNATRQRLEQRARALGLTLSFPRARQGEFLLGLARLEASR